MRVKITEIQRFSLRDGPGIRTVVFFQKCPLRCIWCHNPECQVGEQLLRYAPSRCIRCGACVEVCPQSAHAITDGIHEFRRGDCQVCGKCAAACPTGALEIVGRSATTEEIMEQVRRDKVFYDKSGGGLTLSGGEPLAQAKGVRALLTAAKAEKIHTAVETCGYVQWKSFELLLGLVDLWLYDVKQADMKRHRALTGAANRRIFANLRRLLQAGANVILRVPVIPGQNDDHNSIAALVRRIRDQRLKEIHLMPYNRLAEAKYESIGEEYILEGLATPAPQELDSIKSRFEEVGFEVKIGG